MKGKWIGILTLLLPGMPMLHAQVDSVSVAYTDTTLIIYQLLKNPEIQSLTAGDAVRFNSGVFLRTSTAGGMQLVSAQGLNPQHVQVLWNGIPVNSGMLGVSDLSMFTIGYRQEVVYSSNKSELATGGIAGVVDIKAQPFSTEGYFMQLRQSIGSFGQMSTALSHSGGKGEHAWGLNLNADKAKNDFTFIDYTVLPNEEKRQSHASFKRFAFSPRWQWKGRNGHRLTWQSETVFNERYIPPALVNPMFRALQRDKTTRQQIRWQQFRDRVYHELSGNYIYNYWFYDDIVLSRQGENREHLGYFRYSGYFEPVESWKLFYGADGKLTIVNTPNYKESVREWGTDIHAGAVWKKLPWMQAKAIVKVTARSQLPVYFPAVAELSFYPFKSRDIRLWLRGSVDARYPTLNDRFWQPGGNPDLLSEQSRGGAGGLQAKISLGKYWNWSHSVETFITRVTDMILWLPTNKFYWIPMNIGTVRAFGGVYEQQISMEYRHHQLDAQFSYAYNQSGSIRPITPNDKSVGKQLPYFPLHSLKGTASWRWKGLFLLADLQIYSERFVTRDEGQAIPPYTLANITAGYRHSLKSFTLEGRCSINNLADQYYEEVVYRPMPGRNYLFSLIINWNHEKQNATDL